jgi:glycosyltransferase involved in cell wall biosynthesis
MEVILISPAGEYVQKLNDKGFHWLPWQVGRQTLAPWKELPALIRLTRLYRQESPDLIHHHTIKPVLYGSLAARFLGMSNVVNAITGRGYVFLGDEAKARSLRAVVKQLYRLALGHPNYITTFENKVDQAYFIDQKFAPASRTRLISGVGVDPDRFTPVPEPDGVPIVLYSGRLLWDKGVGVLVEAARILQKTTRVRVVLVGSPDPGNPASIDENQIQEWVSQGTIEWWGWQPDMNRAYAKCHIVCLPTMYGEGVPTVLLEAAACGRPIVASDMPGCQAVIRHEQNGLIVPARDARALAAGLERLLSDQALRGRMGSAGRQMVLQNFTTQQINALNLAVYQEVLGYTGAHTLTHPPLNR